MNILLDEKQLQRAVNEQLQRAVHDEIKYVIEEASLSRAVDSAIKGLLDVSTLRDVAKRAMEQIDTKEIVDTVARSMTIQIRQCLEKGWEESLVTLLHSIRHTGFYTSDQELALKAKIRKELQDERAANLNSGASNPEDEKTDPQVPGHK